MMGGKGPTRDVFVLDSKRHCFLCLEKVMEVTEDGQGGEGGHAWEMGTRTRTTSMQKLCRHLKLEIGRAVLNNDQGKDKKVGGEVPLQQKDSSSGGSNFGGQDQAQGHQKDFGGDGQGHPVDLTVELCQECVQLVGAFSEAYKELGEAELKVASILGGIHGKLLRADESRRMVGEANGDNGGGGGFGGEAGGHLSMLEQLRMKMMNKCVRKLRGVGAPPGSPAQSLETVKNVKSEQADPSTTPGTASSCGDNDDLVKYQWVGVYDVKLEPPESPQVEDDLYLWTGTCGDTDGFSAMESESENPFTGSIISATGKHQGQDSKMKGMGGPDSRDNRDHCPQLPDFQYGQVMEMIDVKLEPQEQTLLGDGDEDDVDVPNNGLEGKLRPKLTPGTRASSWNPNLPQVEVEPPKKKVKKAAKSSTKKKIPSNSDPHPVSPDPDIDMDVVVPVPPPQRVVYGDDPHHGRSWVDPLTSLHQCCCCPQQFSQKGGLYNHHRAVHIGLRFSCPWPGCGREFSRLYRYKGHYQSVHMPGVGQ